jgi:protein phosphatase PTC6
VRLRFLFRLPLTNKLLKNNRLINYRHGGSSVSQWLRQWFHSRFESVDASEIGETYDWLRELGGYFRRFNGGVLRPWVEDPAGAGKMDLGARATLAFLDVRA